MADASNVDGLPTEIWGINYDDISFETEIGHGNFGKVYKGDYFGTEVAVKLLYEVVDEDMKKYVVREVENLKGMHHPNIVQFMGLCKHGAGIYLVTEYIGGGDLRSLLKDKSKTLSWPERVKMARDVSMAMSYLHSKQIIHRDLKSRNLLVDNSYRIKICDLGFARKKQTTDDPNRQAGYMTIAGTDEWMAPEVILGDRYNEKADVFSFGVVLLEFITRDKPPKRGPSTCFQFDEEAVKELVPPDCPPALLALLWKCVQYNPDERPSFRDVLNSLKEILTELGDASAAKAGEQPPPYPAPAVPTSTEGGATASSAEPPAPAPTAATPATTATTPAATDTKPAASETAATNGKEPTLEPAAKQPEPANNGSPPAATTGGEENGKKKDRKKKRTSKRAENGEAGGEHKDKKCTVC